MKFGEYLRENLTSEWVTQYISYDDMKELLIEVVSKAPPATSVEQIAARQEHFLLADDDFFQVRHIELSVICLFVKSDSSSIAKLNCRKLIRSLLRNLLSE